MSCTTQASQGQSYLELNEIRNLVFVVEKLFCAAHSHQKSKFFLKMITKSSELASDVTFSRIAVCCRRSIRCGVRVSFFLLKKKTTSNLGANTIEKGSKAKKPCADKTAEGYLQAHKDMTITTKEQARKTQVDFR